MQRFMQRRQLRMLQPWELFLCSEWTLIDPRTFELPWLLAGRPAAMDDTESFGVNLETADAGTGYAYLDDRDALYRVMEVINS